MREVDSETRVAREMRAQAALETRQAAYMAQLARCQELLAALTVWSDSMGDVTPDEVNWANVGDASKVAADLEGVVEFLGLNVGEEDEEED